MNSVKPNRLKNKMLLKGWGKGFRAKPLAKGRREAISKLSIILAANVGCEGVRGGAIMGDEKVARH